MCNAGKDKLGEPSQGVTGCRMGDGVYKPPIKEHGDGIKVKSKGSVFVINLCVNSDYK
ncbi:MAG TPA: hypothetical protein VFW07_04290 [Parafilimonas sp.]|nr:hypothetical protein [Parafilimonas sp.]